MRTNIAHVASDDRVSVNQCDKKKEISLCALVNSGTSGALTHLRKDHGLLGEVPVDGETTESEPPCRRQRQRRVRLLHVRQQRRNDSAVNEIIAALLPDVQPQERRIRCTNHIYNLSARYELPQGEAQRRT